MAGSGLNATVEEKPPLPLLVGDLGRSGQVISAAVIRTRRASPCSVDCNEAADASSTLTPARCISPGRPSYAGGRLRQHGAFRSGCWTGSHQNGGRHQISNPQADVQNDPSNKNRGPSQLFYRRVVRTEVPAVLMRWRSRFGRFGSRLQPVHIDVP
jgi:hypothetical protein